MKKFTKERFIEKANLIHNEKYDYSLVEYKDIRTKIDIICPIHGKFQQNPNNHLGGSGCIKCRNDIFSINYYGKYTMGSEKFIEKANLIHNNKYDYSITEYKNNHSKIKIICPIHGEFEQIAGNHLNGANCPKCNLENLSKNKLSNINEFTEKSNLIHNEKYDYSLVEYKNSGTKIKIICPIHGEFEQLPGNHINNRSGCPKCVNKISKWEIEVSNFINNELNIKTENNKKLLNGKDIDILIPSKNIGIECNGIYWHTDLKGKYKNYHLEKTILSKEQNIQLIHLWNVEWINKEEIVKSILRNKLGLIENKIYGRKCEIKEISTKEKNKFLEANHLQGNCKSSLNLGLFYNDELISVMTFGKRKITGKESFELLRFCNKINYSIIGGASKLFKFFLKNHWNREEIITYADKRYSDGNLYNQLGFKYSHDSSPNYWYTKDSFNLIHRANFMKHKLKDKLNSFDKNKTEWENMQINGYDRIWDCGNMVFKY